MNESTQTAYVEILAGPDCPGQTFLRDYLKKRTLRELAAKPVAIMPEIKHMPLNLGVSTVNPTQSIPHQELSNLSDSGTPDAKSPFRRLSWPELETMARLDEKRPLVAMANDVTNPDYYDGPPIDSEIPF